MRSVSTSIRNVQSPLIVDVDEFLSPGRGVWCDTVSIYGAPMDVEYNVLAMLSFILMRSRN